MGLFIDKECSYPNKFCMICNIIEYLKKIKNLILVKYYKISKYCFIEN